MWRVFAIITLMLLPKKISDTTRQKNFRKTLEKQIKQLFPEEVIDPSFKLSKHITTLLIDTETIIDHFSVSHTWKMDTNSQLDKTIEQAINLDDITFPHSLDKTLYMHTTHHQTIPSKHGPMLALPFDKTYTMSGNLWHHGSSYELALKGAPEYILAKCDLTENEKETLERKLHQLASSGDKVLAIAHATLSHKINSFSDLTKKDALVFDGFVSLTQHFSPRIKEIVQVAHRAGIAVYLLTGDHPESALHIAKELGIANKKGHVFDSRTAHVIGSHDLEELTQEARVFSRVTRQNKTHIGPLFKSNETLRLTDVRKTIDIL